MSEPSRFLPWMLLTVLSLIWGTSFILIKKGLVVFQPDEVATLRIVAASVVLFPFALRRLKDVRWRHIGLLFVVGLLGNLLPSFLFSFAQTRIDSSVAGILNALTPLFTMLVGVMVFHQVITRKLVVGMIIAFSGTLFLMLAGSGLDLTGLNFYALLIVLATSMYGTNLNLIKFKIAELRALTITSISLAMVGPIAAVYLFGFTDFVHKAQHAEGAWVSLSAVVGLGVVSTGLATVMFNKLVKMTTPIFTSSVTYVMPMIAVAWGLVDGEILLPGHLIGMACIILGVYLVNRKRGR
jgi:drug/metabolite transporter (DMT)-like permease